MVDATPRIALGDRSAFPELAARAYCAHAAISPASTLVGEAVRAVADDYGRVGVGAYLRWDAQRAALRGAIGALVGAPASHVALGPGTSRAVTDIALSLPWRFGDRVVLFEGEFPANITPWQQAAELFGLELVWLSAWQWLQEPEAALARYRAVLSQGRVRLVAVSAVQFQSGLRMPLETLGTLAEAHGAELFVDAIQACGAAPIDVAAEKIHYLACGAHKWLMGMEGFGFLVVAPERAARLRPYTAGWLSHQDGARFLFHGPEELRYDRPFKADAGLFEVGTQNVLGAAALGASLGAIQQLGVDAIYHHVNRYHDALEPALLERGFRSLRAAQPSARSASLCLEVPADVPLPGLAASLASDGVMVSTPDGRLRFAPHWPNSLEEVPVVLHAVDAALAKLR